MTRQEKEDLLREAVDILIKLDNHLMTSRDNAEFTQWVEDLIDNYCEENELKDLSKRVEDIEKQIQEEKEEQLKKLKEQLDYAKFCCAWESRK